MTNRRVLLTFALAAGTLLLSGKARAAESCGDLLIVLDRSSSMVKCQIGGQSREAAAKKAIRAVANGQALFGPGIAQRVMNFFKQVESDLGLGLPKDTFPELTPRELEVLELIAAGKSNSAIAAELVISDKTVRNHITNIFSKLQVADRAEAIIRDDD